MTKVIVNSGICGFSVTIAAEKETGRKIRLSFDTECEMVLKMLEDISQVDTMYVFLNHLANPVYRSAAKHIKHAACPVMSGILKAIEVEAGLALPRDVQIEFIKDQGL
ncbi:MAG: hypothetical protein HZB30_09085 [Nitrospirae bacterium]|nr:hypothetical protein [Nitrospirota bacterium]